MTPSRVPPSAKPPKSKLPGNEASRSAAAPEVSSAAGTLALSRLDGHLCFDIYAASRLITRAYRPLLDGLGLTYPQYLVMLALWQRDHRTVKNLGEMLELDSGTLSPLLKRLEGMGLLRRERTRRDEREVELSLTEVGAAMYARAKDVPEQLACLIRLPAPQVRELQDRLRTLRDNLEAVAEPVGDR
jgi:MarR family transcriptional regulator, organic hydroperoxide resistance regulator